MYWSILVNPKPYLDDQMLVTRFGEEAKFKIHRLSMGGLTKIIVYDVEALWYNGQVVDGVFRDRCNDDVVREIQDHLHYSGHDVISCQLDWGVP